MSLRVLMGLVVGLLLTSCSRPGLLKKDDYLRRPPAEIRAILLSYAPVGSTREHVEEVLRVTLKRKFRVVNYAFLLTPDSFACPTEPGDFSMESYMAAYDWARNFFFAGSFVRAYWLFSKDGKLKDVQVLHTGDNV